MKEIIEKLKARCLSEKAQGIVEYALILAFVAVLATSLASGQGLAAKVGAAFSSIESAFGKTSGTSSTTTTTTTASSADTSGSTASN